MRRQYRRIEALSGKPLSRLSSPGSLKALSSGKRGGGADSGELATGDWEEEEDGECSVDEEEGGGDSVSRSEELS